MKKILVISFIFLSFSVMAQEKTVLTLEECKTIALENNTALKNASLDMIAAKAQKDEIFTNFFPNVSMTGLAFHSLDYMIKMDMVDFFGDNEFGYNMQALWEESAAELGADQTLNYLKYGQRYGVTAIQPVYMGGRIVNGNRYAALGIKAAQLKKSITGRDLMVSVEKDYFDVLALQEKQRTLGSLENLLDSLEKVADLAFSQGVILKSDHMLVHTKRMELDNGKRLLRSGLRLLKMNLLTNIGLQYSVLELDNFIFPQATLEGLPKPEDVYMDENEAAARVEEHQLLDLQVEAKQYQKKLTLGSTLPQVGIGFGYGYTRLSEVNPGRWNGAAFVAVQIPLSDWAKNSYAMKRQQTEIDKAVNDRNHLGDMLVLQQRKLYLELTSAWDALQLAISQQEYVEYLYQQAQLSYDSGYSTITDLLQAYTEVAQKQEGYCNALSDYITCLENYTGRLPSNE